METAQAAWDCSKGLVTLRPVLFKKLAPIFWTWLDQAAQAPHKAEELDDLIDAARQIVDRYYAHKGRDGSELPTARVLAEAAARVIADPGSMFPGELLGYRALPNVVEPSATKPLKVKTSSTKGRSRGYGNTESGKEPGPMPDRTPPKRTLLKDAKKEFAHRPPSHQPGYQRKDRKNKVGLLVQLSKDERAQLHAAAKESGCESTQEFVTKVLSEVAKQYTAEKQEKPTLPEAVKNQRTAARAAAHAAALQLAATLKQG